MGRTAMVVCALLLVGAPARGADPTRNACKFEGAWSATGTRQTLATEADGTASLLHVSGSVVLTIGPELSRGFRGDAIAFYDGRGVTVGRAVWTDEQGDRIFSELKGGPTETGGRTTGTFTGGTGRYAGITGDYSLEWQYVVVTADGTVQGRTTKLEGRYRCQEAQK